MFCVSLFFFFGHKHFISTFIHIQFFCFNFIAFFSKSFRSYFVWMNLSLLLRLAYRVCQQRERRTKNQIYSHWCWRKYVIFYCIFMLLEFWCGLFFRKFSFLWLKARESHSHSLSLSPTLFLFQREILLETVVEQLFVELIYALCLCA